ncbi:MAG: FemAB family PEP-CTERM system-associated protein [Phycisphaerae bacterium]|nr:FemAB family PEP-CTERM system-associated protein [Phycisphaerae bacterium]
MNVGILDISDPACDAFISQRPDAKICHLPAWGAMVERATGQKQFYLIARDNSRACGVLPLTHIRSFLFGNHMVSQGVSNYGGMLVDSPEARDALFEFAVDLAKRLKCESIEFRNSEPLPYNLESREGKISMHLCLSPDPERIWKSFDPKVRNQVRKAEKSNIIVTNGGSEFLNDFYKVYAIRMHQLGTPAYPRELMHSILQEFPHYSRIFVARLHELVIGAGFVICYNGLVEIPWAATLVEYNNLCPNNLLYWLIIKYSCLAGAAYFDFGRCTIGGNTHHFKQQWGPEPVELHYQYWVCPGRQLSILSPDSPKYQRKIELWKRLPLWMANLLSPYISRNLV